MVVAYVGSGGKTTLLHRHACELRDKGLRVLVTTSTRMFIEEDTILTADAGPIIRRLEENGYAMAGVPYGEKIGPLPEETYLSVCQHADVVLVEADGSKHMLLKFPAEHEPVIYDNVDEIIVVCGLRALGMKAREACHRLELVQECLGISEDELITEDHILRLVKEGYLHPLRSCYPGKRITVHPVHDDSPRQAALAELLRRENRQEQDQDFA